MGNPLRGLRLPGKPAFLPNLRGSKVAAEFSLVFGDGTGANVVNGVAYTGNSSYSMAVGSVQEWHLRGGEPPALSAVHPYHQHTTHFQIIDVATDPALHLGLTAEELGMLAAVGDYRDTVPLYYGIRYTVRFRAAFEVGSVCVCVCVCVCV